MSKSTKVALIQLYVGEDKETNIKNALKFIKIAKDNDSEIVILPECFNSPYGTNTAKKFKIYLVGGSIPEVDGETLYNTTTVWNPDGELVAKHRKVHLFNVDLPGKIRFQESEVLTPGSSFNVFETDKFKVGLGICYDCRFPELAHFYQKQGCKLVIYPGAFCDFLGPPHWSLLLRSRALDNQIYVAGVSSARNESADYKSYGHSMFVNPFGEVEASTEYKEDILYGYVDLDKLEEYRQTVPVLKQKRTDLYEISYQQK